MKIMGILNITPDSFSDGGCYDNVDAAIAQTAKMLEEGADIIDIGAESTRPFSDAVSENEEIARLKKILPHLTKRFPNTIFSVDTYRANSAKAAVEMGAKIVNDVTGGQADENIFQTVAQLQCPYILMHTKGMPKEMQIQPVYQNFLQDLQDFFTKQIKKAEDAGIKEIIIDPGFGFGKSLEDNYLLLNNLENFKIFGKKILVGLSRKTMLQKAIDETALNCDNATTVVNTIALMKGIDFLRVHNVKNAVESVKIIRMLKNT